MKGKVLMEGYGRWKQEGMSAREGGSEEGTRKNRERGKEGEGEGRWAETEEA